MKVLFLTHRLPYAPNRGDRIRAYHLLKALNAFADVTLVSLVHDSDEAARTEAMTGLASTVHVVPVPRWRNVIRAVPTLLTARPLTHVLLDAPGLASTIEKSLQTSPDVVFAYCSGMARLAYLPSLADVPLVHDMVDVDSAKWEALAQSSTWPRSAIYAREARALRHFEADVTGRARQTLVVNQRERDLLLTIAPGSRVTALQNGVDTEAFRPKEPPGDAPEVVFTGVFDYRPNEAAALWLLTEVWPIVSSVRPDARLSIVGANPSSRLRRKAATVHSVAVTGAVPDVRPHLWRAAVGVAPIFMSRGVQNKVLEAVASGLPVVTTSAVRDGLPPEVSPAVSVADSPPEFAQVLLRLLSMDPGARRALAGQADVAAIGWESRLADLRRIMAAAASPL